MNINYITSTNQRTLIIGLPFTDNTAWKKLLFGLVITVLHIQLFYFISALQSSEINVLKVQYRPK